MENKKYVVGLAGSSQMGKDALYYALTGHTYSPRALWERDTVGQKGLFSLGDKDFVLRSLPEMDSIFHMEEGKMARELLCFDTPDSMIMVLDDIVLQEKLSLVLEVIEFVPNTILCIWNTFLTPENMDACKLEAMLGIPVIMTDTREGKGTAPVIELLHQIAEGNCNITPIKTIFQDDFYQAVNYVGKHCKHLLPEGIDATYFFSQIVECNSWFYQMLQERQLLDLWQMQELMARGEEVKKIMEESGGGIHVFKKAREDSFSKKAETILKEIA